MSASKDVTKTLESVVRSLPAGESRPGQVAMCEAVAAAMEDRCHLLVEAGTGVGKSLAYLLPAVLSGRRVVVATARRPLQDQLIRNDIPFLRSALGADLEVAVIKGRSNYLCLAKLREAADLDAQGELLDQDDSPKVLRLLAEWSETATSGDLADLPTAVPAGVRSRATVSSRECPGASNCAQGEDCFAEKALERARSADLVVTNIDLYCLDLLVGGGIFGDHEVAVIDEAHELESIAARTMGLDLGRGRLAWLAAQLKGLLVEGSTEPGAVERAGDRLGTALKGSAGRRVEPGSGEIAEALVLADAAVTTAMGVLRALERSPDRQGRIRRAIQASSSLLEDIRAAREIGAGDVAWVPDGGEPTLRVAPVDVGPGLAELLFSRRTTVLTSATLSVGGDLDPLAHRLGLRPELLDGAVGGGGEIGDADEPPAAPAAPQWRGVRVQSPFDYRTNSLLYCARHLPDPRRDGAGFDAAAVEELAGLVQAARGRTLALFTSHRMLRLAAAALEHRFPWEMLVQEGAPQPGLVEAFRDDEHACLLATMGYWQGVDVPGPSLSLVVIDRLPFPRPDDPLLSARRDAAAAAGRNPFVDIDLALAATLLAQGAGRLIRTATDRGVVAVLDPRLARAQYRRALLASMPPMRRTVDGMEVRDFLAAIADGEVDPRGGAALEGGSESDA